MNPMTHSRVGVGNRRRCPTARFLGNGRRYRPLDCRGTSQPKFRGLAKPKLAQCRGDDRGRCSWDSIFKQRPALSSLHGACGGVVREPLGTCEAKACRVSGPGTEFVERRPRCRAVNGVFGSWPWCAAGSRALTGAYESDDALLCWCWRPMSLHDGSIFMQRLTLPASVPDC